MAFNIVAGVNNAVYGSVSGSGSYEENAEVTLEVTVNDGYRFVQWDDGNTDNPRVFNATADVTLVATLEAIPEYAVTLTENNSNLGSTSGSGNYLEGSTATISATPALHCRFVKWDDDNTDNPRTLTVNSAVTLEAIFETVNWYTISTSVNDATMGSVTGAGDYDEGDTVTLTATANTDYKFVMWQDENTDNPRTFTASASGSYEAVFAEIVYADVTIASNDNELGTISGAVSGSMEVGTELTLTATPETDCKFDGWQVDGEIVSTNSTLNLTVIDDVDIIAVFSAIVFYQINILSSDNDCGVASIISQSDEPRGEALNIWPEGAVINLRAIASSSGRFLNWDNGSIDINRTITVDANKTVRANFYPESGLILVTKKMFQKAWTCIKSFFSSSTGASKIGVPVDNALGASNLADVVNSIGQANGLAQLNEDGKVDISSLSGSSAEGLAVNITGNAATATTATTATKIGITTVGSVSQPVYINAGTPAVCNEFAVLYNSAAGEIYDIGYLTVTTGSNQSATYNYDNEAAVTYSQKVSIDTTKTDLHVTVSKTGNFIDFAHTFESVDDQYAYIIKNVYNMPYLTSAPSYNDTGSFTTPVRSGTFGVDSIVIRGSSSFGEGSPWNLVKYEDTSAFFNTNRNDGGYPKWFEIYTDMAINVRAFTLLPRQDATYGADEYPREFKLQGSNDGSSYADIASYTQSTTVNPSNTYYTYKCPSNTGLYKYHRLLISSRMAGTDNVVSLSKFLITEAYTSNTIIATSSSSAYSVDLSSAKVAAGISAVPIGSTSQPVYIDNNGMVAACGSSLDVDITGNAATATTATISTNSTTVKEVYDTSNYNRPLLLTGLNNITTTTDNQTTPVYCNKFYANSSTGMLYATGGFVGNVTGHFTDIIGGRNLLRNTGHTAGGNTTTDGVTVTIGTEVKDTYFYLYNAVALTANKIYTISFDVTNLETDKYIKFRVGGTNNSNFEINVNKNGRIYATGFFTSNTNAGAKFILDDIAKDLPSTSFTLTNFKLEEGEQATAYSNAWEDDIPNATNASNVLQKNATANYNRPLMLTGITNNTTTTNDNREVCYSNNFYANPSTGLMYSKQMLIGKNIGLYSDADGTGESFEHLRLGNATAQGTSGAKSAYLNLYGTGTKFLGIAIGTTNTTDRRLTINSNLTASRAYTLPDADGTLALTSSDITGNAASATKAKVTHTGAAWRDILGVATGFTSASNQDIYGANSGAISYYVDANATSGNQRGILRLGNATANTTAAGHNGEIWLYSTGTTYNTIKSTCTTSSTITLENNHNITWKSAAAVTLTLPSSTGTLALTSSNITGSSASCTGNAASSTYATNIRVTSTQNNNYYYMVGTSGNTASTNYAPAVFPNIVIRDDTNSTSEVFSRLRLGNATAKGTSGGKTGCLTLYGNNTKLCNLLGPEGASADISVRLPKSGGTIALEKEGSVPVYYVQGPSTDTTAGTWTGSITGLTAYYDGLTVLYVPAVAGASATTLNINSLGAKTCYTNNTSALTTHYSVGTPILLTYRDNAWRRADYNSNTTYSAMSVSEGTTGTATTSRTMRADYLKQIIAGLPSASCTGDCGGTATYSTNSKLTHTVGDSEYPLVFGSSFVITDAQQALRIGTPSATGNQCPLRVKAYCAAANTQGEAYLVLGNALAKASANNARGGLVMYGTGTAYNFIKMNTVSTNAKTIFLNTANTADITLTLPAITGRVVVSSDSTPVVDIKVVSSLPASPVANTIYLVK